MFGTVFVYIFFICKFTVDEKVLKKKKLFKGFQMELLKLHIISTGLQYVIVVCLRGMCIKLKACNIDFLITIIKGCFANH